MNYKGSCNIWDLFPVDIDMLFETDILPMLKEMFEKEEKKKNEDDGISGTFVKTSIRDGKVVEHVEKELKNGKWYERKESKPLSRAIEDGNKTCLGPCKIERCSEVQGDEIDTVRKLRNRVAELEAQLKEAQFDYNSLLKMSRQIEEEKDKQIKFLSEKLDKIVKNASKLFVERLTAEGAEIVPDENCNVNKK